MSSLSSSSSAVSRYINNTQQNIQWRVVGDDGVHIVDPTQSTYLTKFTLFPDLPAELKIIIWKFALPPPQGIAPGPVLTPQIAMQSTCRLSREIALQRYTLMAVDFHTTAYLNLSYDFLLVDNFRSLLDWTHPRKSHHPIPKTSLNKINHLAIDIGLPLPPRYWGASPALQRSMDDEYYRIRVVSLWRFTMGYTKELSNLETVIVFGGLGREEGEKFAGYLADHVEKFCEGLRPEVRYLRYERLLSEPKPSQPIQPTQLKCSQVTWGQAIVGVWRRWVGREGK